MAQIKYFSSICVRLKFKALVTYVVNQNIKNPASMKMCVYIPVCVNVLSNGSCMSKLTLECTAKL